MKYPGSDLEQAMENDKKMIKYTSDSTLLYEVAITKASLFRPMLNKRRYYGVRSMGLIIPDSVNYLTATWLK